MTHLWEHVFGEPEGYLCTFTGEQVETGANVLSAPEHEWFEWPGEMVLAAEHLLEEAERGRDAYFGVHLFREPGTRQGGRRGENAVGEVMTLWCDGDGAVVPDAWPQPTLTIESSPGRHHYYWRLEKPIAAERATALNKRIAYGMGGDRGKWGLATVLRAPGTLNYKREETHQVVMLNV